jgi:hypothetical protein
MLIINIIDNHMIRAWSPGSSEECVCGKKPTRFFAIYTCNDVDPITDEPLDFRLRLIYYRCHEHAEILANDPVPPHEKILEISADKALVLSTHLI